MTPQQLRQALQNTLQKPVNRSPAIFAALRNENEKAQPCYGLGIISSPVAGHSKEGCCSGKYIA